MSNDSNAFSGNFSKYRYSETKDQIKEFSMAQPANSKPETLQEEPEDSTIVPSLYSLGGGAMQILTLVILAALFLIVNVTQMDELTAMSFSDALEPQVKAYLFIFNVFCYITIATSLIGVFKSKGERFKLVGVVFLAVLVGIVFNIAVTFLF